MKIAISTIGTFHAFDLARELHGAGLLARIFLATRGSNFSGRRCPRSD